MNVAHIHLLLNHFPTVGMVTGIGLLVFALLSRSEDLRHASLGIFLIISILAIPTYVTGNAAEESIIDNPSVSVEWIQRHEDAALLAFIFMEVTGALAWFALWQFRRRSRMASWNVASVFVLAAVTVGLMARAATMGGEIRHTEIRTGTETVVADSAGWVTALATFFVEKTWAWPASETVHFIGMWLLLGIVLLVNLRMLGLAKSLPFDTLHRLLPWGVLGFAMNVVTGMLFFIAAPQQYTENVSFHLKMLLMVIAGVNVIYFTVFDEAWTLRADDDAPLRGKVVAASTVALWLGVIYFGRMLPFLGQAF